MFTWLSLAFAAEPEVDSAFHRLSRRGERRAERTAAAELRWNTCGEAPDDDRRAQRRAERAVRGLVGARYREVCVVRRLEAWDAPEGEVGVLYATNRLRGPRGFVARDADDLEYGIATVFIPPRHAAGALERELTVRAIDPLPREAFYDALREQLAAAGDDAALLTYVHGYNNAFEYAARRAAQIAHDVDVPVVPVLFAWPSRGGEWLSSAKYPYDENAAARSSPLFADLLGGLFAVAPEASVHVMAHSMGARIVADALIDLDRRAALQGRPIAELVLAAPDIDAAVYERRHLALSTDAAKRVTVYCATDDRALKLSRGFHGGYDRLGSCRADAMAALERPGLEIVDATRLYVNALDHHKVADSPRLLTDLGAVLRGIAAGSPERELVDRRTHFELPP